MQEKTVVVLARNDPREAMRVAAGMTIFGHTVSLIFMHRMLTQEEADCEQAALLELAEIEPMTTVETMSDWFDLLDADKLKSLLREAQVVINI